MYDHQIEVQGHRAQAAKLRLQAQRIMEEAEQRVAALERLARDTEDRADHIHRLCTAGGKAACCHPNPTVQP